MIETMILSAVVFVAPRPVPIRIAPRPAPAKVTPHQEPMRPTPMPVIVPGHVSNNKCKDEKEKEKCK